MERQTIRYNRNYLLYLLLFLLFNCSQKVYDPNITKVNFVKEGPFFVLKLPYSIEDNVHYVFDEDTPYAIDIIEIFANGKKLSTVNKLLFMESPGSFTKHKVNNNRREYFIKMFWMPSEKNKLFWNDGRGTVSIETSYDIFKQSMNTYEISKRTKTLKIKYRIVLPYPNLTIENLYDLNYEDKIYSKEYTLIVDMGNVRNL